MRRLPLHSRRRFAAVAAAGLLAASAAACSSSSTSPGASSSSGAASTGATLVMESSPETSITQAFNPYAPTQPIYGMGANGLIYEPLIQFNVASPPNYYPWLATSYSWADSGKSITFAIRQGVKWNNGTPFTPDDVVFTFNLLKANAAMNLDGLKIVSVSASGNNVTITFPTSQYANLQNIAGSAILPKSVWGSVSNPATFTDPNPVGTGPYMLASFTPAGLHPQAETWLLAGLHGARAEGVLPVYTSNTSALSALFSNRSTGPATSSPACSSSS